MTETTYACTLCHKKRVGRFTRRKQSAGGGWSQGLTLPAWYCWVCLKPGEGRDETPETAETHMAAKAAAPPSIQSGRSEALTKSHEIIALMPPLKQEVEELTVDAETYGYADELLGRVRQARRGWGLVWTRIQEKTIQPIRQGLEELYGLNRDVDKPLETLEEAVKFKMKAFKLEEARLLQAAQKERDDEAARLRREAERKAELEAQARTNQMRGRLAAARQRLEQQAEVVEQQEAPEPVQGVASSTRTLTKWRVKDLRAFYTALGDGTIPVDYALINMPACNRYFKENPDAMRVWPGVEVYEDVQIVGR